ncbi:MAG: hypothetical protein ACPGSC_08075 [Granulosicoccaceae bacterium]
MDIEPCESLASRPSETRVKLLLAESELTDFSLGLFNQYQDLMSSYLLFKKSPLTAGPVEYSDDVTAVSLSSEDSQLLGPNAFMCFLVIQRVQALSSAPELSLSLINQLVNRHRRWGGQVINTLLHLAVDRGLLLYKQKVGDSLASCFEMTEPLSQILRDTQCRYASSRVLSTATNRSKRSPRYECGETDPSDDLQLQIKRAYLAHKNGQFDYVIETTALALRALRRKEQAGLQQVIDQKILLLSVRARALLQCRQTNASEACMIAAIKCMATASTRHPLDSSRQTMCST